MRQHRGGIRDRLYIKEPMVIVLLALFLMGALWLYLAVFTDILQNVRLGPNPSDEQVRAFNSLTARTLICVIPMMFLTSIALLIYGVEGLFRRSKAKRSPLACPHCGMVEASSGLRFEREIVQGTGWASVTCPRCAYNWHVRR